MSTKQPASISVMIVDDHQITRTGLRLMLQLQEEFEIIADAEDGQSAINRALELRPDVILMDVGLPIVDGIEATRQIKAANANSKIIMLSSHDNDEDIHSAIRAGADGYCFKDVSIEALVQGIKSIKTGVCWLDARIMQRMSRAREAELLLPAKSKKQKNTTTTQAAKKHSRAKDTPRMGFDQPISCAPQAELKIGDVFAGRYVVKSFIGRGGMGLVYRAMDNHLERQVAIKVLHAPLVTDRRFLRSLYDEAKAASNLSHPNIITMFDFGVSSQGQPFLVMDYLQGTSLDDILRFEGHLSVSRFLTIFGQVCDGLAAAQSRDIIHCDMKPSNIMVLDHDLDRELVKIVDFGLALTVPKTSDVQSQMTDRQEIVGSPSFMSPEQCCGRRLDFRSDVYSVGCVMYEAITGHNIFPVNSGYEMISMQMAAVPAPFSQLCPELAIPAEIEKIIFKAFAKKPEDRFQTIVELRDALTSVGHQLESIANVDADALSASPL